MAKLLKVCLEDNVCIYLEGCEIDDANDDLLDPVSGNRVVSKTKEFLINSFEQVKSFSTFVAESIQSVPLQPDEFEVKFSVKFSADAGIIISSLSSEAAIGVTMKWTKQKEGG